MTPFKYTNPPEVQVSNDGGLTYIPIEVATMTDLIHPIDVTGDEGMLGVVQAQQVQVSMLGLLWQIWRDVDRCFSPRSSGKLVRHEIFG